MIDIPTPKEIAQEISKRTAEDNAPETASERDLIGAHFFELKMHFKKAERASKGFRDRVNRGKWEGCDIDVRKAVLDGECEPRWCGLDWHRDPDFLPELGSLPFVFYVHEERECSVVECDWKGTTYRRDCPKCKGALAEGSKYAELDDRFIVNIFEDFEHKDENPLGVLLRARAAIKSRKQQLADQRKERRQDAKDRIVHALAPRPMVAVPGGPDAPRIIIPGR